MAYNEKTPLAMNIEDRVKGEESSGGNEARLVSSLLSIVKSFRNLRGIKLAAINIYIGQDEMLMALEADVPVPVSRVNNILAVRPATTSRMLDILEAKGLIRRSANKEYLRKTFVNLTPLGVQKKIEVHAIWRTLDLDIRNDGASNFTLEHIERLDKILIGRLAKLR